MNEAAKQGLIWGLVLTGVGVGIYFLVKKIGEDEDGEGLFSKKPKENEPLLDEEKSLVVDTSSNAPTKVTLMPYKVIQLGSKNIETKFVQWNINELIATAKKVRWWKPYPGMSTETGVSTKKWYDVMDAKDKARTLALASIKPLKDDGEFGAKTLAAVKIVRGKTYTNYCAVRKQRIAYALKYDFKHPFNKDNSCKERQVSPL